MKSFLLFILISIYPIFLFAQYQQCEIILKYGDSLSCFCKEPRNSKITFLKVKRESDSNNIINYPTENIRTLIIGSEDKVEFDRVSRFKSIGNKKPIAPEFLKVLQRGSVTLYYTVVKSLGSPPFKFWLGLRESEEVATILSVNTGGMAITLNPNSQFKKTAPQYFVDFPEIEQKVQNRLYTWENINQLVIDYNNWKSSIK